MLARSRSTNGEFLVHRVRQDDVDNVYVRVVRNPIEVSIVVGVLLRDAVLLLPNSRFFRRTGDDSDQFAVLCFLSQSQEGFFSLCTVALCSR